MDLIFCDKKLGHCKKILRFFFCSSQLNQDKINSFLCMFSHYLNGISLVVSHQTKCLGTCIHYFLCELRLLNVQIRTGKSARTKVIHVLQTNFFRKKCIWQSNFCIRIIDKSVYGYFFIWLRLINSSFFKIHF